MSDPTNVVSYHPRFNTGDIILTDYGTGIVIEVTPQRCLVSTMFGRLTLLPNEMAALICPVDVSFDAEGEGETP